MKMKVSIKIFNSKTSIHLYDILIFFLSSLASISNQKFRIFSSKLFFFFRRCQHFILHYDLLTLEPKEISFENLITDIHMEIFSSLSKSCNEENEEIQKVLDKKNSDNEHYFL